ncbi:uncharacterized protein LOC112183960 [Rosa chinensis]|uniref:uncharacterized protein LOC112183960 n=1 Tax=Rosa chinensis TaxID=74649 RepID=UPI000D09248A|nr:uncharacterized protein LOC112183960 [Rosa chinensis]
MSTFQALYGYAPPSIILYLSSCTSVALVDQQQKSRDALLATIKRNMQLARSRMNGFYDKKHTEREFEVDDWVYLKLQPYKQHSMHKNEFHKLSQRYYGSFQVIEKVRNVAYKLKLPTTARIHNVFHVSLLKKKLGNTVLVEPQLPRITDPENPKWEPMAMLEKRIFRKNSAATT